MAYRMKHPKGKGFPFKESPLASHNDINPGDPRHEEFHYKDKNGDWQPKSAMHMEINKLMPEMSELDVLKVIKSSAGDPDALDKIKKRKEELKED